MLTPKINHKIVVPGVTPPEGHDFHLSYSPRYGLELSLVAKPGGVFERKVLTTQVCAVDYRNYQDDIKAAASSLKAGRGWKPRLGRLPRYQLPTIKD